MISCLRVAARVALLFMVATACASRGPSAGDAALYAEAARETPVGKPYVIGVADIVRVSVWKSEDLSTDAVVRPDGTITLPVVGELPAAGHTAGELQRDIAQRLATIVRDAVVT